ncbi:hypothetical protein FKP32DRAFT_1672062 [Trametes sanguinea]|nr:hypothetical protein FKP32DRAFT_1672062 [Trametes sanguinea]
MTSFELPSISSFVFQDESITFPPLPESESMQLPSLSSLGLAGPSVQQESSPPEIWNQSDSSESCLGLIPGDPVQIPELNDEALADNLVFRFEDFFMPQRNAQASDVEEAVGHEDQQFEEEVWEERHHEHLRMRLIEEYYEQLVDADFDNYVFMDYIITFTSTIVPREVDLYTSST